MTNLQTLSSIQTLVDASAMSPETYVLAPAFEHDPADLADNFYRAVWFLAPRLREGANLVVPVVDDIQLPDAAPHYLDPGLPDVAKELSHQIKFVTPHTLSGVQQVFRGAVVLVHKEERLSQIRADYGDFGVAHFVRVDPAKTQYEASLYLKLTSNDGKGKADQLQACRKRFDALAKTIDTERVFIFGTGPSLDTVDFESLPAGEKLVTNSMVVNDELLGKIRPKLIVASDPIFHAGCSSYAAEFRAKLIKAMREYGSYFIFPMRDYGVYRAHLPEDLHDRLIGVPLVPPAGLNSNLLRSFWVTTTQNVMTLLLLPLASTFSKNVVMAGFDGRPFSESDYYWTHSKASQINDKMAEIKEAHPAFFSLDYNDYLFSHMRKVGEYLDQAETNGTRFVSLTDSYVPAIKGRFVRDVDWSTNRPEVSIIMPTYNPGDFFEEALRSVIQQEVEDWELIIVDDGSTDASPEVAERWAGTDNRIVFHMVERGGVSFARNRGLELARGEYVCFLDADDVLLPNSLKARLSLLGHVGRQAIAYGRLVVTDEKGEPLNIWVGAGGSIAFDNFHLWPAAMNTAMGPAAVMKSNRFDPRLVFAEDWLYFAQLARYGAHLETTKTDIATYRWHPVSATQGNLSRNLVNSSQVFRYIVADEWEDRLVDPRFAAGADPVVFAQTEVRRMHSLLLQCIFADDRAAAAELSQFIRAKTARIALSAFTVDEAERVAVRVYLKPLHSKDLYRHINADAERIVSEIEHCSLDNRSAPFVAAIKALMRRAAIKTGHEKTVDVAGPAKTVSISPPSTPPALTWRQATVRRIYRIIRWVPLVDLALRPIKNRYLEKRKLI